MNHTKLIHCLAIGLLATASISSAMADEEGHTYAVSVTNLTRGVSFTPIMVATHRESIDFFSLGQAPSSALSAMAEGGDTGPLVAMVNATPNGSTASGDSLLEPGQTVTIKVASSDRSRYLSLAAMMLPTNDGFIALNNVPLPRGKQMDTHYSSGYDAGSEPNDEICNNIPGPTCHGEGISLDAGGEGFVHIHAGIHGIGDLQAAEHDWRNPVARITVRQIDR